MTLDTTFPRALLHSLTSHEGQAVAVWQTSPTCFRAHWFGGDDWHWTDPCPTPERARFLAWRGMTGRPMTNENEGVAA